ncbi:MAG: vWA domain-containing protein [Planctomycetota bacterium]
MPARPPAPARRSSCAAGFAAVALLLGALGGGAARADVPPPDPVGKRPEPVRKAIDLALCLDTSGSMQGLIDAARQRMWEVVNELATATPTPTLRVALLTYGSEGSEADGFVVVRAPFTTDLDLVSEKLFALGTNGGTEYVGRVVRTAVGNLQWSGPDAAKILFVAGNESADQDRAAPFREVVKHAFGLGVRVNSIYCGNPDDGDAPLWREVAVVGHGRFAAIDHNHGVVAVATPFDAELADLSGKLNRTYLAYGDKGQEALGRQSAQDANAAPSAPAAAARAASKAGGLYDNRGWDLVDRSREEGFDLDKVPVEELPEEMKAMTPAQRKAHLEAKTAERAAIAAKVKDLDAKRRAYVQAEMAKKGLDDSKALDRAIRDAVREQAAAAGFTFPAR